MFKEVSTAGTQFKQAADKLFGMGSAVYSLAVVALGVETLLYERHGYLTASPDKIIPIIPFLPQIPWLAYAFGAILAASGVALFFNRTVRPAAMVVGCSMFLGAVLLYAPEYIASWGAMSVPARTSIFEPLALAALAWLLPGRGAMPSWLVRAGRYLLALSFIVFGLDHFLALTFLSTLIPNWIPWHVFWIVFSGAGFIAAGVSIALNILLRYAAACIGLMFAVWVFTLHLPRVVRAPHNPDEWSSLLIAVALWGGSWTLARARLEQECPVVSHMQLAGQ